MASSYVLSINTKPLAVKPTKPKMVWPNYRQLLNLDKQKTEKVESDDENEDYLQKILREEKQAKARQQEEAKLHQVQHEKLRKIQEHNKRVLRRIERKRMIEDGVIQPEDVPEEPESEESVEQQEEDVLKPTQPSPPTIEQSAELLKSVPYVQRAKTTSHSRRCLIQKPVKLSQQPTAITNAIYLTDRKALPADYSNYLRQMRSTEPINLSRQLSTRRILPQRRPDPERLSELSKPKSTIGGSRRRNQTQQINLDAFISTQRLQHSSKGAYDFNFVTSSSRDLTRSPKHKSLRQAPTHQQFSLAQLFLRKMFIKGGNQQTFVKQLSKRRRLP